MNYTSFDEIHGKGDKLYLALYNNINTPIYKIKNKKIKIIAEDLKVGDFVIYYPEDNSIIYLVLDNVYALFGVNYSQETLNTFLGILNGLEKNRDKELELEILIPKFKSSRKWFREYKKKINTLTVNMSKVFSNE